MSVGNGKGLTYRVLRSYVDECKERGIDAIAAAREVWGDDIEVVVVDTLPTDEEN